MKHKHKFICRCDKVKQEVLTSESKNKRKTFSLRNGVAFMTKLDELRGEKLFG